jgi:hypothetical protein
MISITLGVIASLLGILIYYVRVMSVAIDEKDAIEKNEELKSRYLRVYRLSAKLERFWLVLEPINETSWSRIISNISLLLVLTLLVFAGAIKEFFIEYSGFLLIVLFVLSSLSNGNKSVAAYKKIKPYLPIIIPAMTYHGLTMLFRDHPQVAGLMVLPGLTFDQSKIAGAATALLLVFIIPYPLAKFDEIFSKFVSRSTLFFTKDLLRLGVTPRNPDDVAYRKVAKETVAFTLKLMVALFGVIAFFAYTP